MISLRPSLSDAIRWLRPGVAFGTTGDTITTWEDADPPPTAAEIYVAQVELARLARHQQRRAARTRAETGGFVFNGHPLDSDRDSILRIGNAATTALISQLSGTPFSTAWTCADEYQMPLDAAGVMALQAALSAHGLACHLRSQALKALIDTPDADLDALAEEIKTGWLPTTLTEA